jgi:putative flippase GtrA
MSVGRIRLSQQLVRFAGVGVISTALHLGLFAALVRGGLGSQLANGVALVVATVFNTAVNRAWTFGVSGRRRLVSHHSQALLVFAITYAATSLALAGLARVAPDAGTLAQTAVVALANLMSTAARYVAMKHWIFAQKATGGDLSRADAVAVPFGAGIDVDASPGEQRGNGAGHDH